MFPKVTAVGNVRENILGLDGIEGEGCDEEGDNYNAQKKRQVSFYMIHV